MEEKTRALDLTIEEMAVVQSACKFFSDYLMQSASRRFNPESKQTKEYVADNITVSRICDSIRNKAFEHVDPIEAIEYEIKDMFPYGM